MMNMGRYDANSAEMHNAKLDQPIPPSFERIGWALMVLLIPKNTAGQARYLLRVTIIRPERNMPDVPSPSADSRCQVFGVYF